MRHKWLLLLGLAVVAFLPFSADAAVNGTHHDMATYLSTASAQFTCYFCHGFKETVNTDQGLGDVGNMCFNRCHSGTGVPGTGTGGLVVVGPNQGSNDGAGTVLGTATTGVNVLRNSHGMTLAIPSPDQAASVTGSNFPHTGTYPTARMECTSCHNVHSNTYAPFLNKPMGDNDATFANTDTVCTTCHAGAAAAPNLRYALITDARASRGGHVIEVALNATNAAGRNTLGMNARTMALKGATLDVPTATGASLNSNANHYDTGGHLFNDDGTITAANADPGTTGGRVVCSTCHSAHMDSSKTSQLLIIRDNGPQNPIASSTTAPLCITCHGAAATPANPGTTAYYHPANGEAVRPYEHATTYWGVSGTFSIVVDTAALPAGTPLGNPGAGAGQDAITCVTCHDVHGGIGGQMAIRNLGQGTGPMCNGCHKGGEGPGTARNSHHMTGTADYSAAPYSYATNPSWTTANGMGNLADGLSCQDCHLFNGTAHNW